MQKPPPVDLPLPAAQRSEFQVPDPGSGLDVHRRVQRGFRLDRHRRSQDSTTHATIERLRRTLSPRGRTGCLDWIRVGNRRHLEHVLARYVAHYNTARPHRGIDLEVPVPGTTAYWC